MRIASFLPSVNASYSTFPQRVRGAAWLHLPRAAWSLTIAVLREWRRRSRERAELAQLDDRMLRDIGVSRGDVLAEINKPFWRR
jgi:uncharacterized protein YjiS (DUF1127 family)